MLYLLDSNAVSDLVAEHPKARARLNALPATDRVVICPIVRGEVLFGIERLPAGKRRDELAKKVVDVLGRIECQPCRESAGDIYAQIKRGNERRGLPLDENDLWIAATAIDLGAKVVSRDADLARVEGLDVEDWTA